MAMLPAALNRQIAQFSEWQSTREEVFAIGWNFTHAGQCAKTI
jgi:hypothetical protein